MREKIVSEELPGLVIMETEDLLLVVKKVPEFFQTFIQITDVLKKSNMLLQLSTVVSKPFQK